MRVALSGSLRHMFETLRQVGKRGDRYRRFSVSRVTSMPPINDWMSYNAACVSIKINGESRKAFQVARDFEHEAARNEAVRGWFFECKKKLSVPYPARIHKHTRNCSSSPALCSGYSRLEVLARLSDCGTSNRCRFRGFRVMN